MSVFRLSESDPALSFPVKTLVRALLDLSSLAVRNCTFPLIDKAADVVALNRITVIHARESNGNADLRFGTVEERSGGCRPQNHAYSGRASGA